MTHVPQPLRESAEFAHARLDALQAALSVALAKGDQELENVWLQAFQNMDEQLVAKWPNIGSAIRARES